MNAVKSRRPLASSSTISYRETLTKCETPINESLLLKSPNQIGLAFNSSVLHNQSHMKLDEQKISGGN